MTTSTKKLLCTLTALLVLVALITLVGCNTFGGVYKPITDEQYHELDQLMLQWPDENYELTYTLKSADTDLTNGIKSIKITYLYKWIDSDDPYAYEIDEINEHIVVEVKTTDGNYRAEYWYVTANQTEITGHMYVQLTSGRDSIKLKTHRENMRAEQPDFLNEKWHDAWDMCGRSFLNIAEKQFYNLHWDIRRALNSENVANISKRGNKYKITKNASDTLEYYYLSLNGENVTAFRLEQTGIDGTITCQINKSNKNVSLPGWHSTVEYMG